MQFGDILRYERENLGLTQNELGEKVGISKQTISKYEKGDVLPAVSTLSDIADTLDCSIDYLLGRVPNRNLSVVEFEKDGKYHKAIVDKENKNEIELIKQEVEKLQARLNNLN